MGGLKSAMGLIDFLKLARRAWVFLYGLVILIRELGLALERRGVVATRGLYAYRS